MNGGVLMSIREAKRLEVMKRMDRNILTMRRASEELEVSLRQAKRIRKRYLNYSGPICLVRKICVIWLYAAEFFGVNFVLYVTKTKRLQS